MSDAFDTRFPRAYAQRLESALRVRELDLRAAQARIAAQQRTIDGLRSRITEGLAGSLGVPASMLAHIPEDARFVPEFTDDGILYRYVPEDQLPPDLPSWTTER